MREKSAKALAKFLNFLGCQEAMRWADYIEQHAHDEGANERIREQNDLLNHMWTLFVDFFYREEDGQQDYQRYCSSHGFNCTWQAASSFVAHDLVNWMDDPGFDFLSESEEEDNEADNDDEEVERTGEGDYVTR
jgi:hypothetical protein